MRSCFSYFLYVFTCVVIVVFVTNEIKKKKKKKKKTILNRTMQISHQNSNRIQIDAVSLLTRQMKPHRFENAPLLAAV